MTLPRNGYLPIEEHGVVGDLRTIALVGTDGTIDWYCPARFDAPSLFASLLDSRKAATSRYTAGRRPVRNSSTCPRRTSWSPASSVRRRSAR